MTQENTTDKRFIELEEKAKVCLSPEEALLLYKQITDIGPRTRPELSEIFHERQIEIVTRLGYVIRGQIKLLEQE